MSITLLRIDLWLLLYGSLLISNEKGLTKW